MTRAVQLLQKPVQNPDWHSEGGLYYTYFERMMVPASSVPALMLSSGALNDLGTKPLRGASSHLSLPVSYDLLMQPAPRMALFNLSIDDNKNLLYKDLQIFFVPAARNIITQYWKTDANVTLAICWNRLWNMALMEKLTTSNLKKLGYELKAALFA